jgi:hypothetical protein
MSRKHYRAMAEALRFERRYIEAMTGDASARVAQWSRDVRAIADVFAADNGRFDRDRFYRACGQEQQS